MKKIIASAGLVAVGAVGLHAANTAGLTPQETAKPWSISASLMGFYDDNYNTAPKDTDLNLGSPGILFRPVFTFNGAYDQTQFRAGVDWSMLYYADRPDNDFDNTVQVFAKLDHRMSERYRLNIGDTFSYTSEPEVLDGGSPMRSEASAIRNYLNLDLTAQLSEVFAIVPGFDWYYLDYFDDGTGSYSARLDRFNYLARVDAKYMAREDLTGLIGYQFGYADYTSKDYLTDPVLFPGSLQGTDRDYSSHYFYLGAEYEFTSQMRVNGKLGAQYSDFRVLPDNTWSPYADIQGSYTYLPGSYALLGVRITQYATDVTTPSGVGATVDNTTANQDYLSAYASVSHKITPKVTGNLTGTYNYSVFNGGDFDGDTENWILLGASVEYKIDSYWSVSAAYNWDYLDSNLSSAFGPPPVRDYTRNRVFAGVTARY